MECYTCKSKMKCTNDVNYDSVRIDCFVCEKCGAEAEIEYDVLKRFIKKVKWIK